MSEQKTPKKDKKDILRRFVGHPGLSLNIGMPMAYPEISGISEEKINAPKNFEVPKLDENAFIGVKESGLSLDELLGLNGEKPIEIKEIELPKSIEKISGQIPFLDKTEPIVAPIDNAPRELRDARRTEYDKRPLYSDFSEDELSLDDIISEECEAATIEELQAAISKVKGQIAEVDDELKKQEQYKNLRKETASEISSINRDLANGEEISQERLQALTNNLDAMAEMLGIEFSEKDEIITQ